ncbi:hypothetical protein NDK47_21145 [Brevibacillus ruminantium]|uniref:Uncharacterized protein n=1 Tax=Brevibacillus ruminantium TaxID=2950604 RepID=A0ABY4WBR3_9BACL|nr:hypothetical protein [Brevibacillus ruminantium]USG64625.1 hypothetical protein NDK47_21145 [Brevibacillus ruminantium]
MRKIRRVLDVTGRIFDQVDFTESTIFFQAHRELPQITEIEVWGLTLKGMQNDEDQYVSGIASISFEGVTSVLLEVSIYQPDGNSFLKVNNDKLLKLSKSWGEPLANEKYQYSLAGVLDWPSGYCQLGIHATGKVTVCFEPNDCVSSGNYVKNPEKYTYKGK